MSRVSGVSTRMLRKKLLQWNLSYILRCYRVNRCVHLWWQWQVISPVCEPLSAHLGDDLGLVVVPESTWQLLVRHARLALLLAPALGQSLRIDHPELVRRLVLPANDVTGRRVEQLGQELPQQSTTCRHHGNRSTLRPPSPRHMLPYSTACHVPKFIITWSWE